MGIAYIGEQRRRERVTTATRGEDRAGAARWQPGELAWIASLDGTVTAAVVASASSDRVRLAMGSTRFAYERGFSPADPSLFHSREEALRYLLMQRSR
jgi:hypothetical protein